MIRPRERRTFALRLALAGAALAVSLTGSAARAQAPDYPPCSKKPSPSEIDLAKGAHKQATEFNDRGDYDKAIQYWRAAYGFDCTAHRLLINIANAYEKKGDKAAAVASLELYLERTGGGDTAIAEKVANLKAAVAAAPPTPGPTQAPTGGPTTPGPTAPQSTIALGERPYGAKPWIVVVTGGAFIVVGGILAPVGYSGISNAETLCPSHVGCSPDVASQGNTGRLEVGLGWTAIAVGAAALGGGLVWQFALNKPATGSTQGSTDRALASVRVAPLVAPKQGGLAVGGSF